MGGRPKHRMINIGNERYSFIAEGRVAEALAAIRATAVKAGTLIHKEVDLPAICMIMDSIDEQRRKLGLEEVKA